MEARRAVPWLSQGGVHDSRRQMRHAQGILRWHTAIGWSDCLFSAVSMQWAGADGRRLDR